MAALVFCKPNPSNVEAVLNGLLAWAGLLGGATAFGSGLSAAALVFTSRTGPDQRADSINRGLGFGFLSGMVAGVGVRRLRE
jgi:hypothetical protein